MTGRLRLAAGGTAIDRARPLSFSFDGERMTGLAGDTLASALLANGVRVVGRSFKHHRPRGVFTAGPEEPNALVAMRKGARHEPNTRATMVELYDGLEAESQNRWPSLRFDLLGINDRLSPIFPAGFYYKTFMWPPRGWMTYEHYIRRAAGLGTAPAGRDPDRYEHRSAHCDVLVVGGGPAGLMAALAAGRAGARVILCDERAELGGSLLRENRAIGDEAGAAWARRISAELDTLPNLRVLPRTTVFGLFDHGMAALIERVADHLPVPPDHTPRQRRWTVRARQIVLATGAIERPLVFAGNDRPGVMLASAARAYVHQYGVRPGARAVVFANNDAGYRTAVDLAAAGIEVVAVVESRVGEGSTHTDELAGIPVFSGHAVVAAYGRFGLTAVDVAPLAEGSTIRRIDCDLLAVSGGLSPTVHLHSHAGGKLAWDEARLCFVPSTGRATVRSVGAAKGSFGLGACFAEGARGGAEAAAAVGFTKPSGVTLPAVPDEPVREPQALWAVPARADRRGKRFVDIQDDVTVEDVGLAAREGYVSVEHLKRYTTLGMGTDQGKTANVNGLALLAQLRGEAIPAVGTTTFRPPFTPVTIGALAGREIGLHFMPIRRTAMHDWHVAQGAVMIETGLWMRPRCYPRAGETPAQAVGREAAHVRNAVGLVDVSTLGKIDVQGPDATEFLQRVYANAWASLPVGKARYGLMLREDGIVFDDGTTSRIGEQRYFMTTTTANAAAVLMHLEYFLQIVWPELRVQVTSETEQWAAMALAGPRSRTVLARVVEGLDVSDASLSFMGVREARVAGLPARIFRISFSGELAYEINAPADYGRALWEALLAAGAGEDIIPYGTEAMGVLRIEKGHVAGPELDGRTTPEDLGLGRLVSAKKPDFIGKHLGSRPALKEAARLRLVGLVAADGISKLRPGAQLVAEPAPILPAKSLGHITSAAHSPTLGHSVALALVSGGLARKGETLYASFLLEESATVPVRVVDPVFVDPEGKRLHG
ncbi:MAG TPA: sarcosine oxidase subunit alpha family protein [Stellaceae bacterium]|nr:sarcosine oxidase subunit alpha family protein [Stellaceae bacterium]